MSADTLRRAAALLRERASAATPGPWRYMQHGIEAGEYDDVIVTGPVQCMSYCYGGTSTLDAFGIHVADRITPRETERLARLILGGGQ